MAPSSMHERDARTGITLSINSIEKASWDAIIGLAVFRLVVWSSTLTDTSEQSI